MLQCTTGMITCVTISQPYGLLRRGIAVTIPAGMPRAAPQIAAGGFGAPSRYIGCGWRPAPLWRLWRHARRPNRAGFIRTRLIRPKAPIYVR